MVYIQDFSASALKIYSDSSSSDWISTYRTLENGKQMTLTLNLTLFIFTSLGKDYTT